jgi:signal transduction histidine kinase
MRQTLECKMEQVVAPEPRGSFVQERAKHSKRGSGSSASVSPTAELIAGIAHELRNPLNQLRGAHDVLCGLADADQRSENVNDAARLHQVLNLSARGMLKVEELLAELQQFGDIPHLVGPDAVEPGPVFRQICLDIESRAKSQGVLLVLEENLRDELRMRLSERGLWRAVMPLLNNALQALDGGTRPILRVSATERSSEYGPTMQIRIEDNGPGIDPILQERVLEPFVSGWNRRGLGLALVNALVTELGGVFSFCSASQGTTFVIDIPVFTR